LYGFGYDSIKFIIKYIKGIVVKDLEELDKVRKLKISIKTIILFEKNKEKLTYFCMNKIGDNEKKSTKKTYIRVDPFLGMHGISLDELKKIQNLKDYYGILIYLNECLTENEEMELQKIIKIAKDNNLLLNIGGSKILDYLYKLKGYDKIEIRLLRRILFSDDNKSTMFLRSRLINSLNVNKKFNIGFKSDRKTFYDGYLYLVSFGYNDLKILPLLYKNNIPLKIGKSYYDIACYPCMNTTWLYSKTKKNLEDVFDVFREYHEILKACEILDIDIDEFYTSFNTEIKRIYK